MAPVCYDTSIDPSLFRVCLQRRLRQQVQPYDDDCLAYGYTMDSYGDHALTCACKGDRTTRHNKLRNIVYEEAFCGGLQAEREK